MKKGPLGVAFVAIAAMGCPEGAVNDPRDGLRRRLETRTALATLIPNAGKCEAQFISEEIKLRSGSGSRTGMVFGAYNGCKDEEKIAIKAVKRYPLKTDETPDHTKPQDFEITKALVCYGDEGTRVEDAFRLKGGEFKIIYCLAKEKYDDADPLRAALRFCAAVAGGECVKAEEGPRSNELEIIVLP